MPRRAWVAVVLAAPAVPSPAIRSSSAAPRAVLTFVMGNAADQPRAVTEIKRSEVAGGLRLDALRVIGFL